MKQILALNAFDMSGAASLGERGQSLVQRRHQVFGAASVLFYETPLELVRGEGCWLFDPSGERYLDVYNNVPSVGHCHPHVVAAVSAQLGKINTHTRYLHDDVLAYAERLLTTFPAALSNVTFTCTGSESNDLALRLAATFSGGRGVLVTETAYHGNTEAVTDVSPCSARNRSLPPHVRVVRAPDSYRVPADRMEGRFRHDVAEAIADLERNGIRLSALLVDSIFSSDGVYADPPGFLRAAVDEVHAHGGLFIADEVQPGFGRTGSAMWGFQRHSVVPDIVTMGKPMGNGFPMGGVVTRPEILDAFCADVGYFNTFGGSQAAAAAGMAVLDVLESEGLIKNAETVGLYLRDRLRDLALRRPVMGDVRGAGLFNAVELVSDPEAKIPGSEIASAVINGLRERRVLIGAAGPFGHTLKIRPPLCFGEEHVDVLVSALDDVLGSVPL